MNKVILITGASSGIGLAIASYLSGRGFIVYGGSRSANPSTAFHALKLDVANRNSVESAVELIRREQGRIDVLINNAGVGVVGSVEMTMLEDVKKAYEVNVFGAVNVCQVVLPIMRERKQGKIINISSLGSAIGMPFRGFYSSSKAALDIITEALRFEVSGFGIQACTLHPGEVNTAIADHRIMSSNSNEPVYGGAITNALQSMNEGVKKGQNPENFGPIVEKLIHSRKLKRSYFAGAFTEELGITLKKFLPASSYEAMLRSHFKSDDKARKG